MGKRINVKPAEILKIEFEDGTSRDCKFTAYAMMILDEEFEGFQQVFRSAEKKPFSAGAKLLYAGMKACDDTVTYDEAKKIACNMSINNILDLFEFAAATIEVDTEKKKKIPQDHLKK
ncbi:hypothetical protein [Acinetobacter sp.]|uniref:hypothetical protein n=1 Tax=Acinetobacter sp. TaxID=472 RepID=UPI003CFDD168